MLNAPKCPDATPRSCPSGVGSDKVAGMPEEKASLLTNLVARARRSLRVIRCNWGTFVVVAGVCILATASVNWFSLSHRLHVLRSRNAALQERINAFASTPPSQWRRLNDRTRGLVLAGLEQPDNDFKLLVVYAAADSESRQYAAQFVDAARLVGVDTRPREFAPAVSPEVGVAVGTATATPSEQAQKLKDILSSAGLDVRFAPWTKLPADDAPVDFALFVGPKPW